MGGGGTMRSAAKIAGFGVTRAGLRASPSTIVTERFSRSPTRQRSSPGVASQGLKAPEMAPLHSAASVDLSDWEFADAGDLIMSAGEPMPRVVFGDVPTMEEAKEATIELKEAIDKMYLSSDSSESEGSSGGSSAGNQISVLHHTLFESVNKSRAFDALSNPVPQHAIQALELLSASAEVQTVVASIACDSNVWKAVMQNPAVSTFFQSQQKVADESFAKVVELTEDSSGSEGVEAREKVEEPELQSGIVFDFMHLLQNLKLSVAEMVSRVSNYLQNIFPTTEKETDGNPKAMDNMTFMGGTFMGLATLVIMVVLVKRA